MKNIFYKMHGLGNDFVIFDDRADGSLVLTENRIKLLADRRTGIGCDQLILLQATPDADALMRIFNADGSEVATCGNATRCVAALLHAQSPRTHYAIRTAAGLLAAMVVGDQPLKIRVDMGRPNHDWQAIPLAEPADSLHLPIAGTPAATSMGNPHVTFFVPDVEDHPVAALGAQLETHPMFPAHANVGFAQILDRTHIRLRVWERGAGLTRACGSGACAAAVNAHRRGLTDRSVTLLLDGGTLWIDWQEDRHVFMTGGASTVYEGRIDLESLPA